MKVAGFIIILCLSVINCLAQNAVPWFTTDELLEDDSKALETVDCTWRLGDSANNATIIEFVSLPFFNHSSSNFKKWSNKEYLINCFANLTQIDGSNFLILKLVINSTTAKRTYGDLEKGARMKLFFSNGDFIYLENIEKDRGRLFRAEEHTRYTCVMAIDKSDRKTLLKNPVYKLGIMWEEAYQEYEIQNIDLIMNQLNCLNNI